MSTEPKKLVLPDDWSAERRRVVYGFKSIIDAMKSAPKPVERVTWGELHALLAAFGVARVSEIPESCLDMAERWLQSRSASLNMPEVLVGELR